MRDFEYEAPATLARVVELLAREDGRSRPLAGGTDLIDHVRTGRLAPDLLVDIKKIPELNVFEIDSRGLRLGAAVPCYRIYGHPQVAEEYAALADSCRIIGGVQIQSRASVGGNLCNSGPAADTIPSLIALDAICVIDGPRGTREIPASEFCTGPGTNVLRPGELLVEIRIPPRPVRSGSHYRRMIPRNEMDIAVVGVAASVEIDESMKNFISGRIALGAVAATPLFAEEASAVLAGRPIDDETISQAAEAARAIIDPLDDMRGTRDYRRHVAGVLVERVVKAAVTRAHGEELAYRPGC